MVLLKSISEPMSWTTASMSEPANPSETSASSATRWLGMAWLVYFQKHRSMMSVRSVSVGRSTKKISSKRPLRSSSGGRVETSLAVATMKTLAWDSWSQKRNWPMRRFVTELSPEPVARPFSISSIQSTQGAMRSAVSRASRRFCSDSPTYIPRMAPMSSR